MKRKRNPPKSNPRNLQPVFVPSRTPFPIFNLPRELRLCIYEQCTPFALLQLASTSSLIRTEIHSSTPILRKVVGSPNLIIRNIEMLDDLEVKLWRKNLNKRWGTARKHSPGRHWIRFAEAKGDMVKPILQGFDEDDDTVVFPFSLERPVERFYGSPIRLRIFWVRKSEEVEYWEAGETGKDMVMAPSGFTWMGVDGLFDLLW
ncbi:hypothetical protein BJ508DRAFT_328337 [Ascobolus immersus RN42]|uniref:F-box domain-containing protein n=1 Tax=Ascobolus immersus RN42 TaxID=1160509 RepID=A0A3N4I428_ASCIM|nr:hypothetical protein BJ508DRAFT_328337 [Ascobolus immersus RN42]